MNELVRHFLDTYARGGEVDGGWLYAKALQQARLDYSPDSLARLDLLMTSIRDRVKPSPADIVETPQGRNFCSLVAFYLVEVVVRRTGAEIQWLDHATAQSVLPPGPPLPEGPFSHLVAWAPDQGRVFLSLAWPQGRLLGEIAPLRASDYVDNLCAQLAAEAPVVWWTATRALGLMASRAMSFVADGATVQPTLMHPGDGGGATFVSLAYGNQGQAIEEGRARLAANADGLPWSVFAYDAFANLPDGTRTEAVVVDLRTYGDDPLELGIVFPYRRAADGLPFAISASIVSHANVPRQRLLQLNGAIERGIQGWTWPFGGTWSEHEKAAQAPAASAGPGALPAPTYADGEPVRAGDAVLSDRGFFPARIVQIRVDDSGAPACVFEDCNGDLRLLPGAAASDWFVRTASGVSDRAAAAAAGVKWLEHQAQHGQRGKGVVPGAMLSAGHARHALGNLYSQGIGVERNVTLALRAWQVAADSGYAPAECEIGRAHLPGGEAGANPQKALNYLRRAADKGDARALCILGREHEAGKIVPVDLALAADLLGRSAAGGDAGAMSSLSRLYRDGRGVAPDAARALALMQQAAEAGDAQSQYELALAFTKGEGVAQDYAQCVRWYERSAAQGHRGAINNLADKLEHGLGVAQDLARAIALYRQAADLNISAAWYSLARMAAEGRGMARDLDEAVRLMTVAASQDFDDAKALLAQYQQERDRDPASRP